MELFTRKYTFNCNECGKTFELNGHWYNQVGIHEYNKVRYCWHKLMKHSRVLSKSELLYILKLHVKLPIVLLCELLNIMCIPFRKL